MSRHLIYLGLTGLLLVGLSFFFSYRILTVPLAMTSDEGGFAVNAVHLARDGHDENGFPYPVFALSLGGKEWRQPVTQYYIAAFFKVFGESFFNLRYSSVVITLICAVLMYLVVKPLLDNKWALFATFVFLTVPLVMMQSHLALDNLMPVPFVLVWLLMLVRHSKSKKPLYLVIAGASLGIAFYTYKGMRATVPVWCVLTVGYLIITEWKNRFRTLVPQLVAFALGAAPFFLVIPNLEKMYPGAVWDKKGFAWSSWYSFLEPYIASFDLSFLFIRGDATLFHSTGRHGMFLVTTLPLMLVGVYSAIKKKSLWGLAVLAFFTAPLLFGFVNSIHRASRLMAMIPPYVMLATLGAHEIWQKKKLLVVVIAALMIVNYGDFVNFYWNRYPELTRDIFGDASYYRDFETFNLEADRRQLIKYVDSAISYDDGATGEFFRLIYLDDDTRYLFGDEALPEGGILLSLTGNREGLQLLDVPRAHYSIWVNAGDN